MPTQNKLASVGLLALRIAIGGLMLVHGLQKLMNFSELAGQFPDPLGMGSQLSLIAAIGAEVGCSLLVMLGLGTRLAALPLAFTMFVALFLVHASDPWQMKELAAVYLCVYLSLILTGGGEFSIDQWILKHKRQEPAEAAVSTG